MARTNTNVNNGITANTADSVQGDGSFSNPIKLVGDQAAPGTSRYYGTNSIGTKGFFSISSLVLPSLADANIWIGDVLNTANPHALSGIIKLSDTGVTSFFANSFSSNDLLTALTDETGGNKAVFSKSPHFDDTIFVGTNGANTGLIQLIAKTAGALNITIPDPSSTWQLTLPSNVPASNGMSLIAQTSGGTSWAFPTVSGNTALTNDKIWIGNGTNVATEQSVSGIVNMTNTGVFAFNALSFSSANLLAAMTTLTGSNLNVFSNNPTFDTQITIGQAGGTSPGTTNFVGNTSGLSVSVRANGNTAASVITLPTTVANNHDMLTSQGGAAGQTAWTSSLRNHISSYFESSASRFATSTSSGGSINFGAGGVQMDVVGATGSFVLLQVSAGNTNYHTFAKNPTIYSAFSFKTMGATGSLYVGMGNVTVLATGHTYTTNHIGFKVLIVAGVASLYATQGDGVTENASAALTTFAVNEYIEVLAVVNVTSTDYYWSKGSAGSITTGTTNLISNMPAILTADNIVFQGSIASDGTASNHECTFPFENYSRLII